MWSHDTPITAGDRGSDHRTPVSGVIKPPVLSRRAIRALCVVCLAAIVYGTLGPLGSSSRHWVVAVDARRWVPASAVSSQSDVLTNFAVYVPVGVAFRLLVRRRGRAGWRDLLLGFGLSVALSYVTELVQQAMPARRSSLTDVQVNSAGALVGSLLAVRVQWLLRRLHAAAFRRLWTDRRRAPVGLVLAMLLLGIAGLEWRRALPRGPVQASPQVQWVPFRATFMQPFPGMFTEPMRQLVTYAALTTALLLVTRGRRPILALGLSLGLAGGMETARAFTHPYGADLTTPVVAFTGWLIAVRLWRSFHPATTAFGTSGP